MERRLVAGIDSSTQQTKLVIVDVNTGNLVHSSALPHPDGTEVEPEHWWAATDGVGGESPPGAIALSIAAQQHTSIFLNEHGDSARPALLWNDLRARQSARDLRSEFGDEAWLDSVGLLPEATHPVSKLRWLAEHEPENAKRVTSVMLPHDWLTWRVLDRPQTSTTDRSDASATGYWSARDERYRPDLMKVALGHSIQTPVVMPANTIVGTSATGLHLAAGCGDNAATHLALDTQILDMVISIGTSVTVSMRTSLPATDRTGSVDLMADTRSGFIPLISMLNGARVLTATAKMLGVTHERLNRLAADAPRDANGALLVPHLDGERKPTVDISSGRLVGLSRSSMTPESIARAAVLGLGCAIANAVDQIVAVHGAPKRILLVGGGARASALRQTVSDLIGSSLEWPEHREHAAFGAARQAAWALTGTDPDWAPQPTQLTLASDRLSWVPDVRHRYRTAILGDSS